MQGKKVLRQQMKEVLYAQKPSIYEEQSKQMIHHLFRHPFWQNASTVGTTVALKGEMDTRPLIEAGWQQGKRMVVPRVKRKEKEMDFYELEDFSMLEITFSGLAEPFPDRCQLIEKSRIDLLIVPALAFNKQGYRLGYGGGYYDRYLEGYTGNTISLAFSCQLLGQLPVDEHDLPVQQLITPEGIIC